MRRICLTALLFLATPASTADLLERTLTVEDGLPGQWVTALAQAPDGSLWLGGPTGLVRWDGTQSRAIGTGVIGHFVSRIAIGGDRIIAIEEHGVAWEVDGDAVRPVLGPDGDRLALRDGWIDPQGRFYVLSGGKIWRDGPPGSWTLALDGPIAEELRRVDSGPDGRLLLGGRTGWWTWDPGQPPEWLIAGSGAIQGLVDEAGDIWLSDRSPVRIRRRHKGAWSEVWRDPDVRTNYGFTVRDGTVWTGHDGIVWSIDAATGRAERFGSEGRWMRLKGPWLTDADGSVWAGGYEGAIQLPEPDLRTWGVAAGLPSAQVRSLVVHQDTLVAGTWRGYIRIAEGEVSEPTPWIGKGMVCQDAQGVAWGRVVDEDRADYYLIVHPDGRVQHRPAPSGGYMLHGCAPSADGHVWFLAGGHLSRTRGWDEPPRDYGDVPVPTRRNHRLVEGRDGRLWALGDRSVCVAPVAEIEAGRAQWTCHAVPARTHIDDIHQTEAGSIWVAERTVGMLRLSREGFEPIPAAAELPTHNLKGLADSPRGGTWILGAMAPMRVLDRPDTAAGWEVVERLPDWMGGLFSAVKDLVELPDGTLWLATHAGVVRIPPQARATLPAAPGLSISEVLVNGEAVPLATQTIEAGAQLTVRTAAGTLLHPQLIRYRHRIDAGSWSAPTLLPGVELASLSPGPHEVEIAATYDRRTWSETPARFRVQVRAPLWQRPWVWGIGLTGLAVVFGGILAARARIRLREEQLRTRVAMDLHDEIGAGLASIGLLAGLAGQRGSAPDRARELARRIAGDAEALGASVSGMVWSLRPGHTLPSALADFIEARARAMLPLLDAAGDLHVSRGPDLDGLGALDLDVLRAVQLAVQEALHNISKHAAATEVRITLARRGAHLDIAIVDDGVGFDPESLPPEAERGLGLRSMDTRLRSVGGSAEIGPRSEGGTRVHLSVPPRRPRWFGI